MPTRPNTSPRKGDQHEATTKGRNTPTNPTIRGYILYPEGAEKWLSCPLYIYKGTTINTSILKPQPTHPKQDTRVPNTTTPLNRAQSK